jgi:hypothetical protein
MKLLMNFSQLGSDLLPKTEGYIAGMAPEVASGTVRGWIEDRTVLPTSGPKPFPLLESGNHASSRPGAGFVRNPELGPQHS